MYKRFSQFSFVCFSLMFLKKATFLIHSVTEKKNSYVKALMISVTVKPFSLPFITEQAQEPYGSTFHLYFYLNIRAFLILSC